MSIIKRKIRKDQSFESGLGFRIPGEVYKRLRELRLIYPAFGKGALRQKEFINLFHSLNTPRAVREYVLASYIDEQAAERISRELQGGYQFKQSLKLVKYKGGLMLYDITTNRIFKVRKRQKLKGWRYVSRNLHKIAAAAMQTKMSLKLYDWVRNVWQFLFFLDRVLANLARKFISFLYANYEPLMDQMELDATFIEGLSWATNYIPLIEDAINTMDGIFQFVIRLDAKLYEDFWRLREKLIHLDKLLNEYDELYYAYGYHHPWEVKVILWETRHTRNLLHRIVKKMEYDIDYSKFDKQGFRDNFVVPRYESQYMTKEIRTTPASKIRKTFKIWDKMNKL